MQEISMLAQLQLAWYIELCRQPAALPWLHGVVLPHLRCHFHATVRVV